MVLPAQVIALTQTAWTLVLGGDIMLNGISPKTKPFEKVTEVFREADVAIANLEIPLTRSKTLTSRKSATEVKARTQFVLRADPKHIEGLREAGFDMLSLGNNHSMDYGWSGLSETLGLLESAGIGWAGAGQDWAKAVEPAIATTQNGTRVAMVSYLAFVTERAMRKCWPARTSSPGIAVLPLGGVIDKKAKERLKAIVERARRDADFVIVALHWGVERQAVPIPYQVSLGRGFAEAGADLVWGHHPHTLQGSELYDGVPILYSTGNLVSSRPGTTAIYRLKFEGRKLKSTEILPFTIAGGKVVPNLKPDTKTAITDLDRKLRKRYPSKRSTNPSSTS